MKTRGLRPSVFTGASSVFFEALDVVVVLWIKRLVQELHFGAVISPDPVHCKKLQA
jgi:hypothetical protein